MYILFELFQQVVGMIPTHVKSLRWHDFLIFNANCTGSKVIEMEETVVYLLCEYLALANKIHKFFGHYIQ